MARGVGMTARTIWKFPVELTDRFEVEMPEGAEVLCVAPQDLASILGPMFAAGDSVFMWALVDPDAPPTTRPFFLVGTGHALPNFANLRHLGTFQLQAGALVFHLFEPLEAEG